MKSSFKSVVIYKKRVFFFGVLIFVIFLLQGVEGFAFSGLDIYVFRPESLAYYLKFDESRINEIQEILQNRDYSNKVCPKLRLQIDSILSKKENHTFEGYVSLVNPMSVFDYALLSFPLLGISYCDMGADNVKANFLLSTIPMMLSNPLIQRIGVDSADCEAMPVLPSQEQLAEAQNLIIKNKSEIIKDLGLKSPHRKMDDSLDALLRYEKNSKTKKDTTIYVRLFLLEKWSDKMGIQFTQKGIKSAKKINDYIIEAGVPIEKVKDLLSDESVIYVMKADTNCEEFFIHKRKKQKPPVTEFVDD